MAIKIGDEVVIYRKTKHDFFAPFQHRFIGVRGKVVSSEYRHLKIPSFGVRFDGLPSGVYEVPLSCLKRIT